jgi:tRNA pseudouridine38-40 synthase
MNYYKATIQYDGTDYFGFQWQKGIPSIQADFNLALEKCLGGKLSTRGASRTDTGVHALRQIVKITTENPFECEPFLIKLNFALPSQIRVLSLVPCLGSFNPIVEAVSKEYRYFFTTTLKSSGHHQKYVTNHPYFLNLAPMQKCCEMIVGEHDFSNFYSVGSKVKSTTREIFNCKISLVNLRNTLSGNKLFSITDDLTECFEFKIEGKGFLKQMVRHLVGAIWLVGRGKLSENDFKMLLTGPKEIKKLWKVADSRGLFLYNFTYKE